MAELACPFSYIYIGIIYLITKRLRISLALFCYSCYIYFVTVQIHFYLHLSSVGQHPHLLFHGQIITVVETLTTAFLSMLYCL